MSTLTNRPRGDAEAVQEQVNVAPLLRAVLGILWAAAAGFAIFEGIRGDTATMQAAIGYALASPFLLWTVKKGWHSGAAIATVLLLLVVAGHVVMHGGGLHDNGMMLFPLVMLLSGLVLNGRLALLMYSFCVLVPVALGVFEMRGWWTTSLSGEVEYDDLIHVGVLLAITALLVHRLTRALYRGLEQALTAQASYREIYDATSEAIFVHDVDSGAMIDANEAAVSMTGLAKKDLLKLTTADFSSSVKGATLEDAARYRDLAKAGRPQVFSWQWRRPDGSCIKAEVSLRMAWIGGHERLLAVVRDVSERQQWLARAQETEKLQAIGQLAGGIAHDFNNQLTGIIGSAHLLAEGVADDKSLLQHVQVIKDSASHSARLTRQLLAFARKGKHQNVPVDCVEIVEQVVSLLKSSLDKRIVIETRIARAPAFTIGDPTLLQNALLNLAINARDAMPQGGRLLFGLAPVQLGPQERPAWTQELPVGDYWSLHIEDTGEGIDDQIRAHLFEPFFTTKTNGHGMGLAAVYGTVKSHLGAIQVTSANGKGTTFELLLPAARETRKPIPGDSMPAGSLLAGVRALVVDDEPAVARVAVRILQNAGCTTRSCSSGEELVRQLEGPDAFDVIVLDDGLADMSGTELLARLRAQGMTVPVVLCSGYFGRAPRIGPDSAQIFLAKPYKPGELTGAVQSALAAAKPGR